MKKLLKNNFKSLTLVIIVISLGLVIAGNVIVKEGDLDVDDELEVTGDIRLVSDSNKIEVGAESGGDLRLYHTGSDSVIDHTTTGNFYVRN